jgi:hypothetical protein
VLGWARQQLVLVLALVSVLELVLELAMPLLELGEVLG